MNLKPHIAFASLVTLAACSSARTQRLGPDGQLPSPAEYDNSEPVWWTMRPMTELPPALHAEGSTLTATVDAARWTIQHGDRRFVFGTPVRTTTSGMQIDRGFMSRATHQEQSDGRTLDELWVETFRGSPIVSFFRRQWNLRNNLGRSTLEIEGQKCVLRSFTGDVLVKDQSPELTLTVADTTKPYLIVHDPESKRGVVLFFAMPAELRTWHAEDYELELQFDLQITVTPTRRGCVINLPEPDYDKDWAKGPYRRSVERQVFVMPYDGPWKPALREIHIGRRHLASGKSAFGDRLEGGYWQIPPQQGSTPVHYGLRMLRYFPTEFVSWVGTARLPYGHDKGLTWGLTTKVMKGAHMRPNAKRALTRDLALRMLVFFLEAGREKGAPPNLLTHPDWALQFKDPTKIREVVFTQFWEFRLQEFARLLNSPQLRPDEKRRVYEELQRARVVHDPKGEHTWTTETPNGGLWFDYFDEPLGEENRFIVNTHTTSVGNVGEFALLARDFGTEADFVYWQDLFRRGVLGLKWATKQRWSWTDTDENEVVYSKVGTGPSAYHYWMMTSWVPRATRLAYELAPDDVDYLLSLMKRLTQARFLSAEERARGVNMLDKLEAGPKRGKHHRKKRPRKP